MQSNNAIAAAVRSPAVVQRPEQVGALAIQKTLAHIVLVHSCRIKVAVFALQCRQQPAVLYSVTFHQQDGKIARQSCLVDIIPEHAESPATSG